MLQAQPVEPQAKRPKACPCIFVKGSKSTLCDIVRITALMFAPECNQRDDVRPAKSRQPPQRREFL